MASRAGSTPVADRGARPPWAGPPPCGRASASRSTRARWSGGPGCRTAAGRCGRMSWSRSTGGRRDSCRSTARPTTSACGTRFGVERPAFDPRRFLHRFTVWCPETHLGRLYRERLAASANVRVLLHATATEIVTSPSERALRLGACGDARGQAGARTRQGVRAERRRGRERAPAARVRRRPRRGRGERGGCRRAVLPGSPQRPLRDGHGQPHGAPARALRPASRCACPLSAAALAEP